MEPRGICLGLEFARVVFILRRTWRCRWGGGEPFSRNLWGVAGMFGKAVQDALGGEAQYEGLSTPPPQPRTLSSSLYCVGFGLVWSGTYNPPPQPNTLSSPTHHARTQVFNELPLEFAAEVNELMSLKLEGTVG